MPATPHHPVSLEQIASWHDDLTALQERIAPRFVRAEVRARAGHYLAGLLAPIERRNGWQLAEALGERNPDGVQRLLRTAQWDADAVRDDLRAYVVEHLGDPDAVLVIDETGFLKKGTKSAGVARQYSGTAGRIENSQIGVFLAYASPRGQAFLDRALYLPKAWAEDAPRREDAGIPSDIEFATKGDLAQTMLARAFAADVPAAWVTGDEIYGNDGDLRRWLEAEQRPYVLAVARTHPIWERGRQVRMDALVEQIPEEAWQRIAVGDGSKGPRIYDWACARLPYLTEAGGRSGCCSAARVSDPEELRLLPRLWPGGDPVAELARVAGTRWTIEEGFQQAKAIGLDEYEVRTLGRGGIGTSRSACWPMPSSPSPVPLRRGAQKGGAWRPDPAHHPGGAALCSPSCSWTMNSVSTGCTGPAGVANARPKPAAATTNAASPALDHDLPL